MKLIPQELRKLWLNPFFVLCLLCMVLVNVFLLWSGVGISNSDIPPSAYKNIDEDLRNLSENEKLEFIQGRYDMVYALLQIDWYVLQGSSVHQVPSEDMAETLLEYGALYDAGNYPLYTSNLQQEFSFLTSILAEIESVEGYNEFLDGIQIKAHQLGEISIFAEETTGYDHATIKKTAEAYAHLENVAIRYSPQKGYYVATSFVFSDLISLFAVFLLSSLIIRDERDNGLLLLIRSTRGGRGKTAVAKIAAFAISTLAILFCIYGANLLFCEWRYGLGNLSRSVQSNPFLMRCTMTISCFRYLCLFLLAKWGANFVIGLCVMAFALYARRALPGCLGALTVLAVQLVLRLIVPATSTWNILKYANMISLLNSNELLGVYRNLHFFGSPVELPATECLTAIVLSGVFLSIFIRMFAVSELRIAERRSPRHGRQRKWFTTVRAEEGHKLLVVNAALIVLIAALGYQGFVLSQQQSYIDSDEIYYRYYMDSISGRYTRETYEWLQEANEEFAPIRELEQQYANHEISELEFSMRMGEYYSLQQKMMVFENRVLPRARYVLDTPDASIVYETGYCLLFDFEDSQDIYDTLLTGALVSLCFSGLFALEKQSGMIKVIQATARGRSYTLKRKLFMAAIVSGVVMLLIILPRYIQVFRDYGFKGLLASANSIPDYARVSSFFPLFGIILISILFKYVGCFTMACIVLAFSQKTGNTMQTLLLSATTFCLPTLLSITGVNQAKWLSVYPIFHFPAMLLRISYSVFFVLILIACLMCSTFCLYYLHECYAEHIAK